MPHIYAQQTINSFATLELLETALELENRFINMKNCGETLKLKEKNTTKPPQRLKQLLNKNRLQTEEIGDRDLFNKSTISIGDVTISVEEINGGELEILRYILKTPSNPAVSKNSRTIFSQMPKYFNLKTTQLLLQQRGAPFQPISTLNIRSFNTAAIKPTNAIVHPLVKQVSLQASSA
ncbi:hypothetical protein [Pseudomonas fluorescens]|uniref:Uncharacterized protein n=1 Tax=Pseudomonas fluorescens TaxID=294 RepID=A0A5E7GH45_PSEFL|nr:hypothetical protein [Pseudomonas fluorescens]VVO48233.1 hypothetical protein PS880_00161 [Pseudomonas fluorescens]